MIKKIFYSLVVLCTLFVGYIAYHGFQPCYDVRLKVINNLDYPVEVDVGSNKEGSMYFKDKIEPISVVLSKIELISEDQYNIKVWDTNQKKLFEAKAGYFIPATETEHHIVIDETGIRMSTPKYASIMRYLEAFNNLARCMI